eukprot:2295092-Alexandrium_andersonii.AAC.1
MAASIALDTAIPCDHLTAAAWRHLNWRTGRLRFRVEGAGAEVRLTVYGARPDGEEPAPPPAFPPPPPMADGVGLGPLPGLRAALGVATGAAIGG